MANTVISLRSSGISSNTPSLGVLANGELSLNFADGILYYKSAANALGSIRTTQPTGLNQEIQFNDSGSFGGNSSLTFNKTSGILSTNNVTANSVATTSYIQFNDGSKQFTANAGSGSTQNVTISTFNTTANGTTLSYDLGFNPVTANAIFVTIDGVVQPESTYTVNTSANTITFGAEPANTENVRVVAFASTNPYILADGSIDPSKLSVSTNNFITAAADAAFTKANSANVLAQAAFNQANTDVTLISATAGVYGNASIVPVFTLAANGRVSAVTNTAIAISAAAVTSGTLAVAQGGTGVATSTGTGAVVLNTAPTLTSINVTNTTVSTSNITGAITVSGGIGVKGNVSANGIIFDDGTRQTTAVSVGDVLALSIALG